jgi:hypothetical protein
MMVQITHIFHSLTLLTTKSSNDILPLVPTPTQSQLSEDAKYPNHTQKENACLLAYAYANASTVMKENDATAIRTVQLTVRGTTH